MRSAQVGDTLLTASFLLPYEIGTSKICHQIFVPNKMPSEVSFSFINVKEKTDHTEEN
jgi:hypothetical protein